MESGEAIAISQALCLGQCWHALKHAAVAITLVEADDGSGETALILTGRAAGLRSHGGQWALPGGRMDAGETPVVAALRELSDDNGLRWVDVTPNGAGGITIPIVPGLMPVPSRRSLAVMTAMSGATVPSGLQAKIDEAGGDDDVRAIGVQHCIAQCAELLERGVPGLHFYTFNRARAPLEILAALRGQQLIAS